MPYRQVNIPSFGRTLSNLMGAPSSSQHGGHEAGLDAFRELGGNCLHLHGEGGETESKEATGKWLRDCGNREDFFLCTQVCHDSWDEVNRRPINRFTPEALREDVIIDLELLGTGHLDLVYLDDSPLSACEPMVDAMAEEIACKRVRAFGVRNWRAERIRAAIAYATARSLPRISAIVTTELSLPRAARPLWPEYLPFDAELFDVVNEWSLTVFAHVEDFTSGQVLFGGEDALSRMRPEWISRWDAPGNPEIVSRVREYAKAKGLTPREVCIAHTLGHGFPVIGMVGLPSLAGKLCQEYERASGIVQDESDRVWLRGEARED